MEKKPRRRIGDRIISALLRQATVKLGVFEFHGPALIIYPVEMILIGVIIVLIFRPDILSSLLEAVMK